MEEDAGAQRPYRVVLVAHSHVVGGIERHVVELARALRERGHWVAFAGPLDGWLGESMRAAGHRCLHLPMHGMYDPWSAWRLARFCARERASIVHGQAQRGARYAAWATRRAGLACVATAHSTNAWKWFDASAHIIAVSDAVRASLLARGLPAASVHVVRSGVRDLGARHAAPARSDGALSLVMLSRLEPVKGHDVALQALHEIGDRLACRLLVFGPDDSQWARRVRELAASLRVADRVEFRGATDDPGAALALADIVLAPSRREALSLTLVEAAAVGRAAIAADVGGIPEVVDDGRTGLLFPAGDAHALARAILRLGADAALRERLARAARERFEQSFTLDAMLDGTLRIYAIAERAVLNR
ncbi:MAG: glycosyltransferase family 4 protein [Burkholderiaceae bacterium]|nr:glycosyltransferase family 4 protein [Burkholderiaceae bacterium]